MPINEIINMDRVGILLALPWTKYKIHKETIVISNRHHTSIVESNVMALPKTPVNPHRKTATFNCINAFFIDVKETASLRNEERFLLY